MPAAWTIAASAGPPSPSSSSVGASLAIPSETSDCGVGDEHQRLLEQPAAAHEQVLLAAALGMVAGIRLVDREHEQVEGRHAAGRR